jgi:hypothetical protein
MADCTERCAPSIHFATERADPDLRILPYPLCETFVEQFPRSHGRRDRRERPGSLHCDDLDVHTLMLT